MEENETRRKFELEKLKVESETRQKAIQAKKQKEVEQSEKEKAEREFELKKLQLELESRARESHTAVDGSSDHTALHVPNIKVMKLPPFHEDKDDLDAYLNRFESCLLYTSPSPRD